MNTDLHGTFEMRYIVAGQTDTLADAIDLASDQDRSTVLTEHGKPVAAIVPIEVLEFYERNLPIGAGIPAPSGRGGCQSSAGFRELLAWYANALDKWGDKS